jgi:hypothetical protein
VLETVIASTESRPQLAVAKHMLPHVFKIQQFQTPNFKQCVKDAYSRTSNNRCFVRSEHLECCGMPFEEYRQGNVTVKSNVVQYEHGQEWEKATAEVCGERSIRGTFVTDLVSVPRSPNHEKLRGLADDGDQFIKTWKEFAAGLIMEVRIANVTVLRIIEIQGLWLEGAKLTPGPVRHVTFVKSREATIVTSVGL